MNFFNKNLLIMTIVLLTYVNTYTITTESISTVVENLISSNSTSTSSSSSISTFDVAPYNFIAETSTETVVFQTVRHEDKIVLMADYRNNETGEIAHVETPLYPDSSLSNQNGQFDLQLPSSNSDISDISNTSKEHDHFSDHLNESARDAQRQGMDENHATQTQNRTNKQIRFIREQDLQRNRVYYPWDFGGIPLDSDLILRNLNTFHDPRTILSSSIIKLRFDRLSNFYTYKIDLGQNFRLERDFVDVLRSGKVVELLNQVYNADLPTAKVAFNELQKLWIRKRKHMFLVNNSYNNRELNFIARLGIDVMATAERTLITRSDYIAEHTHEQSLKTIQEYKNHCTQLQQKGNRSALWDEIKKLLPNVKKKSDFSIKVSLAIAKKTFFDPVTTALYEIAHAPSLEMACRHLKNLELQILTQAQQRNIVNEDHMRKWTIEHYGFDLLDAAQKCYKSRTDYIYTPENQSYLSDTMKPILRNIKSKNLPKAHAELVNLEKQVAQGLEQLNITNSIEQKEYLIQEFGSDVRKEAQAAYKGRQDHKDMVDAFNAIKVEDALITILDEHTNYVEITDKMAAVAESVLENAELCQLPFAKDVEPHIFSSLHVMRNTNNPVEFIYNATAVDIMLTDLQNHSEAILDGKTASLEKCTKLTSRAVGKFIEGLNPITQAQNMGHALVMAGKVATYPIVHPIDTTEKVYNAADRVADYLIANAYFTTSLTVGKLYLSPIEYQARLDRYLQSIDDLPSNPVANLTAENWVDLIAQVAADFVFGKGFVGVIAYLKEIDAMSKISRQARKVGEILIHGVDAHLKKNPIFITTEGIVLKAANDIKNVGEKLKNSSIGQRVILRVANMQEFFELPFGKICFEHSIKTPYRYQNPIYKITSNIPGTKLKEGYFYYLDKLHGDHIEVFNKKLQAIGVYNLDGTFNTKKFAAAQKTGRNLKGYM